MLAKTPDGGEIYYEVYDFSDPWTSSETILLHHGLRGTHQLWYSWIPILAREYRVVPISARGRGGSTVPPPGFDWNLDQFSSDALAVMDALEVDRFHWLGTSFGSAIGEYTAAKSGDRIKSLTLLSPPYRFTHLSHVVDGWLADYEELGADEFLKRDVRNMFPDVTDDALMDWHAGQMASVPDHVATDMLRYMATVNLESLLPEIQVPTLIIGAKHSDRAPSSEGEHMQTLIPNCEMISLDGHHNITLMMVDECTSAALEFIRRH